MIDFTMYRTPPLTFLVFVSVCVSVATPFVVSADMRMTEVMYDILGTDTSREWIEVCNTGDTDVMLSEWRLFEADTNHKITTTPSSENGILGGHVCAIIADKPETFSVDMPEYVGRVFDSTFSLSNTGETLILRDADLIDRDTLVYDASAGATGDGNTLSRTSSGTWVATAPNPGVWNPSSLPAPLEIEDEGNQENDTDTTPTEEESSGTASSSSSSYVWIPKPNIYAYAGKDRTVLAGASVAFSGQGAGESKTPLKTAEYIWNFGDGTIVRGQSVFHTYRYPGTYVAYLTVVSGDAQGGDSVAIMAKEPLLSVSDVGMNQENRYIEITNGAKEEIELSYWYLRAGTKFFQIPEHTYIRPGTAVRFAEETTGLAPSSPDRAELLYPNMRVFASYVPHDDTGVDSVTETVSATVAATERVVANVLSSIHENLSVSVADRTQPSVSVSSDTMSSNTTMFPVEDTMSLEDDIVVPDETNLTDEALSLQNAVATPSATTGSPERSFWYIALGGVLVLGIAGAMIASGGEKKSISSTAVASESDEYEILEDDE